MLKAKGGAGFRQNPAREARWDYSGPFGDRHRAGTKLHHWRLFKPKKMAPRLVRNQSHSGD